MPEHPREAQQQALPIYYKEIRRVLRILYLSRSAQLLRGLFGFKVKSLYKKSLGSSVDYQGYCFGVFGRYSNNTVPGPQQS